MTEGMCTVMQWPVDADFKRDKLMLRLQHAERLRSIEVLELIKDEINLCDCPENSTNVHTHFSNTVPLFACPDHLMVLILPNFLDVTRLSISNLVGDHL